jgi:hypothetical protein
MSATHKVWLYDRDEQLSRPAPRLPPTPDGKPDLQVLILSQDGNDLEVEIVAGRLSEVLALFWIDGLGWFEAKKLKKLSPPADRREDRVQLRLSRWGN